MRLYVVRHGETVKNQFGLIQGQTEADLNENGINEAKKLRELIDSLNVDVVISSPLRRAKDTARLITNDKYVYNMKYDELTQASFAFGSCGNPQKGV